MWPALVTGRPAAPWLAGSEDDPAGPAPGAAPAPSPGPAARKPRLLVVEDEWLIVLQLESYLRAAGYEIIGIARSAADAAALAASLRPDLALLDIRLAGPVDGISLAQDLRTRHDIPSLFVSGNLDMQTMARAERAQPAGFVHKPFGSTELVAAVEAALAGILPRP